ncbi:hypothetical protein [Verrucomicrobium sp. BvORR034]|uniref:hypothetical protein n=1 Tax=Verrucomicrobium sp. BvORR034 TaxID=1396418 RepID=UPI00067974C8|nr:hypothetical protein [Verrucomicrobium sp. BvORR034]
MKPSYVIPALWAAFLVAGAFGQIPAAPVAPAASPPLEVAPTPDVWSTKTYRFPASEMAQGFVSPTVGQLRAPQIPKANAPVEDGEIFLKRSDMVVTQYLKTMGIQVPEGSLMSFDPVNQTLVARTSGRAHEELQVYSYELLKRVAKTIHLSTYLIEAEAATVRQIVNETAGNGDHSPQLAKLRALVGEGKARQVDLLRVETRSGQRASVERGEERLLVSEFEGSFKGWTSVSHEMRPVGSKMEVDPVLGPDDEIIDLNLALNHHYRAPQDRWEPVALSGSGQQADVRVTDLYTVEASTAQSLRQGTARLIGVWKPEGAPEPARENVLLVAILKADLVRIMPALQPQLETLFAAQGEKVRPTPATAPAELLNQGLPKGMKLRRFRVPPSFFSGDLSNPSGAGVGAADPFSAAAAPATEPRMSVKMTALDILRSQGLVFPPGSSANYSAGTSELIVRNTPENVSEVEAFIEGLNRSLPANLAFNVQVVQADGAFLRKLEEQYASEADHTAMWKALEEAVAQGKAKFVQTLWLGGRSGQRIATQVGREYTKVPEAGGGSPVSESKARPTPTPTPAADNKAPAAPAPEGAAQSDAGDPSFIAGVTEMSRVGLTLELDPVIGPDGQTVDVNYQLKRDYLPPTWRAPLKSEDLKVLKIDAPATGFHKATTTTSITVLSGMTRLIGLWKPEGAPEYDKADVMQAAFLKTDIELLKVSGN